MPFRRDSPEGALRDWPGRAGSSAPLCLFGDKRAAAPGADGATTSFAYTGLNRNFQAAS